MTLNGFLRDVGAAHRRAVRNEERRQRAYARAAKLQAKLNELEHAQAEVEEYNARVEELTAVQRTVGEEMDWPDLAARPAPRAPGRLTRWQDEAVRVRNDFKPTFWQRLFGKEAKLRAQLETAVDEARQRDDVSWKAALKLHAQQQSQWAELHALSTLIVQGDAKAYCQALKELEPLSEMQEAGCTFDINFPDHLTAVIELGVESDRVVPKEVKTLTRTGKLSVKAMPQGKFFELYQDYVCGCVLRTAREFFSFLPVDRVVVQVSATLLDSSTGHLRPQCILSVAIPRASMGRINFAAVDASDAMSLFPHRMGFKRSQGFYPVNPLTAEEYPTLTR